MPYPYKGESKGTSVARIVIEPNPNKGHEEMPGDLEILFLDEDDNLVDVWSATDLKTAGSLLSRYGTQEDSDYTPKIKEKKASPSEKEEVKLVEPEEEEKPLREEAKKSRPKKKDLPGRIAKPGEEFEAAPEPPWNYAVSGPV